MEVAVAHLATRKGGKQSSSVGATAGSGETRRVRARHIKPSVDECILCYTKVRTHEYVRVRLLGWKACVNVCTSCQESRASNSEENPCSNRHCECWRDNASSTTSRISPALCKVCTAAKTFLPERLPPDYPAAIPFPDDDSLYKLDEVLQLFVEAEVEKLSSPDSPIGGGSGERTNFCGLPVLRLVLTELQQIMKVQTRALFIDIGCGSGTVVAAAAMIESICSLGIEICYEWYLHAQSTVAELVVKQKKYELAEEVNTEREEDCKVTRHRICPGPALKGTPLIIHGDASREWLSPAYRRGSLMWANDTNIGDRVAAKISEAIASKEEKGYRENSTMISFADKIVPDRAGQRVTVYSLSNVKHCLGSVSASGVDKLYVRHHADQLLKTPPKKKQKTQKTLPASYVGNCARLHAFLVTKEQEISAWSDWAAQKENRGRGKVVAVIVCVKDIELVQKAVIQNVFRGGKEPPLHTPLLFCGEDILKDVKPLWDLVRFSTNFDEFYSKCKRSEVGLPDDVGQRQHAIDNLEELLKLEPGWEPPTPDIDCDGYGDSGGDADGHALRGVRVI